MEYPTFKMRGFPTPYDKLMVCDRCETAEWHPYSTGNQSYCCSARMRKATQEEYKEGKIALKHIIG